MILQMADRKLPRRRRPRSTILHVPDHPATTPHHSLAVKCKTAGYHLTARVHLPSAQLPRKGARTVTRMTPRLSPRGSRVPADQRTPDLLLQPPSQTTHMHPADASHSLETLSTSNHDSFSAESETVPGHLHHRPTLCYHDPSAARPIYAVRRSHGEGRTRIQVTPI